MASLQVKIDNKTLGKINIPDKVFRTLKYSDLEHETDQCFKTVRTKITEKFGVELRGKLWLWFPKDRMPVICN